MNKKETINPKEFRNLNNDAKKMNNSDKLKKKSDKDLPWWVELLFVQIGLPDKLLVKILKAKRNSKELINNEKNSFITILILIISFIYFYPVIRYAKNKLDCETNAKNYIIENRNVVKINNKKLRMLSTNFCNGGNEINRIEN